jgi:hypothetical protein
MIRASEPPINSRLSAGIFEARSILGKAPPLTELVLLVIWLLRICFFDTKGSYTMI